LRSDAIDRCQLGKWKSRWLANPKLRPADAVIGVSELPETEPLDTVRSEPRSALLSRDLFESRCKGAQPDEY
jgi:hypothetical protein